MSCYTPSQIISEIKETASQKNINLNRKLFISAILGGAFIALGSMFAITIAGGLSGLKEFYPGLVKLFFGITFPLGFLLVTITKAELFTSTTAVTTVGIYSRTIKFRNLIRIWSISYLGNFIGALFIVYLIAVPSKIFKADYYSQFIQDIANHKVSYDFLTVFIKGIAANWLVCLASFLTYSAKDTVGKIVALWIPVTAFVAMGFEHSIANMFFVPLGGEFGASITFGQFLSGNLIPATLGNIVGGSLFVGVVFSYLYYKKDNNSQ